MPLVRLPRKSGARAPQRITGINWSSPLADGLVALVTVQGGVPIEWVTGQPFTSVNGAGVRGYPVWNGQGTDTNGSNSYWRLDGSWSLDVTATSGISMAARWNSDVSQASRWLATFASSTDTNPIYGWVQNNSSGTNEILAYVRNDGGTSNISQPSPNGGLTGDRTAVWTWDKEQYFDAAFTREFLWANRAQTTGSNITTTGLTYTFDRLALGCLLRGSAAGFFDGSVAWAAWWNRGITPYELELMWRNPVSEMTRQTTRTYFIPAAAGGATISDIPVRGMNITPQAPTTLRALISQIPAL